MFSLLLIVIDCIPRSVEVLRKSCFPNAKIGAMTIENDPKSTRIEESCFRSCFLASICIPRPVEILRKSCFLNAMVEAMAFESKSKLIRIEKLCFHSCLLKSVCIPRSAEVLRRSCFASDWGRSNQTGDIVFEKDSKFI